MDGIAQLPNQNLGQGNELLLLPGKVECPLSMKVPARNEMPPRRTVWNPVRTGQAEP